VTDRAIRFTFPDPERELRGVRLYQEVVRPRRGPEFTYDSDGRQWVCDFPRPEADRLEYLIELEHPDGERSLTTDPGNPRVAPGPFGDKSVVEMPGYRPPAWTVAETANPGNITSIELPCRAVKGTLSGLLWGPADAEPTEPLPLLIAHDGPEYAALSSLTQFFDALSATGRLPRFRAALIGPRDRDEIYSASAAYGRSIAHEVIPALAELVPVIPGRSGRVGMGSSLGALALLHAHRRAPETFGALYLQSGSYFRQRFDRQESGFVRFRRISRFVGEVLATQHWAHPIDVVMTCGRIEENLANNRAATEALSSQGYDVRLFINRDGHNWVGWRDTFDPHLVGLLNEVWG
jgi:enterochelin esterase family protein